MNSDAVAVADEKMSQAEPANTPTILDYLNEDCWRIVFNYLPVRDVIQSERVSQRWQTMVLTYIRGNRIGVENQCMALRNSNELHRNACWILASGLPSQSFERWTSKLGASLISMYCASEECLRIIGENCPNLEDVQFVDLPVEPILKSWNEHFRWLKRMWFIDCLCVTDRCISQLATSKALEELEIYRNHQITGQCLRTIKYNLKCLVLHQCISLDHRNLSYLERFSDLTKLVLNFYKDPDLVPPLYSEFRNVHRALRHLRKLEHLEIYFNDNGCGYGDLTRAVCELRCLRHLAGQIVCNDQDLIDVVRCCNQLSSLHMDPSYDVTSKGLTAASRIAPKLTALGFHESELSDDDIVACVYDFPELKLLDVRSRLMTRAVIERVEDARIYMGAPRPLHLKLDPEMVMDLSFDDCMNNSTLVVGF